MKKPAAKPALPSNPSDADEMAAEYDFSDAVRNPYADQYQAGMIVVTIDPDVAAHFPTATAVNAALRGLIEKT